MPPKDRDIAMVFQHYALYPHMTVRKNLQLSLRRRKVPRDVIESRTAEVTALLKIDSLLDRLPTAALRRTATARRGRPGDHARAKVFLMDEPLSNLDTRLRMETRRELITLQRRLGRTFVYVTHDQNEAMTMGAGSRSCATGCSSNTGARSTSFAARRTCSSGASWAR